MSEAMIVAEKLTKVYGTFMAIGDVSFRIKAGSITAFLGPNGAGKSTTMKILTGFLAPTSGQASICGMRVSEHRREVAEKIGYLPENGPLYLDMTPYGLLRFFGEARGMEPARLKESIDRVTELCALGQVLKKRIEKLSRGYRQRVCLAQALLHKPQVLILDEPTSGLDPNQARHVRESLRKLGKKTTILLSTHLMSEISLLADRVLLISQGRIKFDGTPEQFTEQADTLENSFHALAGLGSE